MGLSFQFAEELKIALNMGDSDDWRQVAGGFRNGGRAQEPLFLEVTEFPSGFCQRVLGARAVEGQAAEGDRLFLVAGIEVLEEIGFQRIDRAEVPIGADDAIGEEAFDFAGG